MFAVDGGCRVCKPGFYRHEKTCLKCGPLCRTCANGDSCTTCNDEHFMNTEGVCANKSAIVGCAEAVDSDIGCPRCQDGFFLRDRECFLCNASHANCSSCVEHLCMACDADFVMKGKKCVPLQSIAHCTAAADSRCTRCTFWHTPTLRGDDCQSHVVWWVILLASIVVLVVVVILLLGGVLLVNRLMRKLRTAEVRETACVFAIARSNVTFASIPHSKIVANKQKVVYDDGALPIDVESKALLCVGNKGRKMVKVQFIAKDGVDKFTVRTNPTVVTLEKGTACEFEVYVTPLCSTAIDDKVLFVVKEFSGKTTNTFIPVQAETELTSKLHYDDIVCEKQIGEGSFGIVFKGKFRGETVAVKKMKGVGVTDESMDEFAKEVAMLDKFRCDFIVHFYGACLIPNHVMMVTEFAPCGSLADCIQKRSEPADRLKAKVMLDAAKGLAYLHGNGILHRDVKPDNVLVFSLDEELAVNGKLTDFGSSRNVNMLMTNMTFTKGVGTPIYMAPEMISKEKYKKAADVYSFGVMLFECFKWGDAYPKEQFKFPWSVANFVSSGKRLPIPSTIPQAIQECIVDCWKQEPSQRIGLFQFFLTSRFATVC